MLVGFQLSTVYHHSEFCQYVIIEKCKNNNIFQSIYIQKAIDDKTNIMQNGGMSMEEKKKKRGCLIPALIVIVLVGVIGALAGGNSNESAPSAGNDSQSSTQAASADEQQKSEPEKTEFTIGETAEQNGISVTLVSATKSSGSEYITPAEGNVFLLLQFEIANNSDSDITISSVASFEAYCDDYSINQSLMGLQAPEADGMNQLDGSVAAGKKMQGVIAYEVSNAFQTFEVSVSPDFWSSKDIKFIVANAT